MIFPECFGFPLDKINDYSDKIYNVRQGERKKKVANIIGSIEWICKINININIFKWVYLAWNLNNVIRLITLKREWIKDKFEMSTISKQQRTCIALFASVYQPKYSQKSISFNIPSQCEDFVKSSCWFDKCMCPCVYVFVCTFYG